MALVSRPLFPCPVHRCMHSRQAERQWPGLAQSERSAPKGSRVRCTLASIACGTSAIASVHPVFNAVGSRGTASAARCGSAPNFCSRWSCVRVCYRTAAALRRLASACTCGPLQTQPRGRGAASEQKESSRCTGTAFMTLWHPVAPPDWRAAAVSTRTCMPPQRDSEHRRCGAARWSTPRCSVLATPGRLAKPHAGGLARQR